MLIELKVWRAVVIHQAITPWLVAAAHRQGGAIGSRAQLVWQGIGLGCGGHHHWGLQGAQPALRFSPQNFRASARLNSCLRFSKGIS